MSEPSVTALVALLAGLTMACLSCLPWLLHRMATLNPSSQYDDHWRDQAPMLIRWSRRLTVPLVQQVDQRMRPATRQKIVRRLQESGLYYAIMPAEIVVLRWLSVLAVAVIVLPLLWLTGRLGLAQMVAALALLPIAYAYVDIWLRDQAKRRKLRIEKDFPFFLDVLVLSMKAGLAFPGAIQQATTQLPDGPIKQELSRLIREVRTGTSRSEGLQRLALRVRLASVSNFVAVAAQADESGGSLTKALHEQARQRRRERFQRAEKLANQAPVKMLFPLVAFLFPVTFIIIGFPLYEQLVGSGFLQ